MASNLILGIEGGGTKTECAALDESGQLLGYGRGGPANLNFVSAQEQQNAIRTAIEGALEGLKGVVRVVGFAAAGSPKEVSWLRRWFPEIAIFRYGELQAAMATTGLLRAHGMAVVAGTGSLIGYFRDNQCLGAVGGWGSWLGDEGSAHDIAMRAIHAAIRASDGRAAETSLGEVVCRYFGIEHLGGLIQVFYPQPPPRHRIAGLAPEVSRLAEEQGDPVAIQILQSAGDLLAQDAIAGAKRYFSPDEGIPVALCGGVFKSRQHFLPAFERTLLSAFPKAQLRFPRHRPATAVARLTLRDWKRR